MGCYRRQDSMKHRNISSFANEKLIFANAYGMMFNALLYQHDRFFLAERISVAIQHRTIGLPLIMFSIFECKKTRRTLRYVLLRFNVTLGKEV